MRSLLVHDILSSWTRREGGFHGVRTDFFNGLLGDGDTTVALLMPTLGVIYVGQQERLD